ncbi:Hypothetical protein LUCI_4026 [Lucifera butyrica]|uniref:Uncharacterized protein n=1 Tax=Lucifera butyrica TaxID=1351585 RepID=A0A498RCV8_9FIRM|nr:hypothetical protein [Lucifera butyrica]VBB08747.1 Hypothetical protein LUCI_4026 [Lucifera butyrica]
MSRIWLELFVIMMVGSIFKEGFLNIMFWVLIDLVVLAACYWRLKRYPYIDMKKSMLFLGGITAVNILIDLGVLSSMLGNILFLALLLWMIVGGSDRGGGPRRSNLRHKWHK